MVPVMSSQRERINYLLFAALIIIGIVSYIAWFFTHHELVENEVRKGVSSEVRRNPFLAAEMFLDVNGVNVESISGRDKLHKLPPSSDVLLVNNLGAKLSSERFQALLTWIENGGHLITTAHQLYDDEKLESGDQLLDELGIQLVKVCSCKIDPNEEPLDDIESLDSDEQFDSEYSPNYSSLYPVNIEFESGETVEVKFNGDYELIDSREIASVEVASERGVHLLQVPRGDGLITIMSDNEFLKNPSYFSLFNLDLSELVGYTSIADADHAYYLWLLVGTENKVWLLYGLQTEGIFNLIWNNAREFSISFIILLLLWLWWQSNRFGPLLGSVEAPRRNLMEHISMNSDYAWKQDRGQRLLQKNRDHFLAWLGQKHPQIAKLDEQDVCRKISELINMPVEKVYQALFGDWSSEREFIQQSFNIQTMRKQL